MNKIYLEKNDFNCSKDKLFEIVKKNHALNHKK